MAEKPRFYDVKVAKIVPLSPTVKHFVCEFPAGADTSFIAGQFSMVHLEKEGKPHKKAYSIASSPSLKGKVEYSIKLVEGGYVSTWWFGLKEGDTIHVSLPYGMFHLKEPFTPHMVFVGTGTGIAPLRGMIQNLFERSYKGEITLVFGNRYEDEILYLDEWKALEAKHPNFHFIPTVSRPKSPWKGETAYVQDVVKKTFEGKIEGLGFYGCGLVPMCKTLRETLVAMNVPKERIHFEQFT